MARAGASSRRLRRRSRAPGEELYAAKADVARMPASVKKLYTTAGALLRYGADGRLDDHGPRRRPAGRGRHDRRQPRPARRRRPDVQRRERARLAEQLAQAGLSASRAA